MTLNDILELDKSDPLSYKRDQFELPDDLIYLDGNSLGALPMVARDMAAEIVHDQWGKGLIRSWNTNHWIDLPINVGEKIAPLLGASPGQLICCDSISVNLFKLLSAALNMQNERSVVLSQQDNFPADLYIAQGLSQLCGSEFCDLKIVEEEDIVAALDESVAVLMLTHINYKSGRLHDIQGLTRLAHEKGILVIWDLAHSAGAVPLELDDWQVDFAVGCGYKYLNGGPGAPAFIYAAKHHQDRVQQPLSGWMGHRAPFSFEPGYRAAAGMLQFLCGTPPIVSMGIFAASLGIFEDIDMCVLRKKSIKLGKLFLQLVEDDDRLEELRLVSPRKSHERGSQISFSHPQAFAICQALIDRGVIADFRAPDVLRFGLSPLYLRYRDIWDSVQMLSDILAKGAYKQARYARQTKVT
jgi:kynureninase